MTRTPLTVLLFGSALLAGCSDRANPAAEQAKLMETSREWARAAASGDVDAMMRYWSDDALVIQPDQPMWRGKGAIRRFLETSMKTPGFRITWEPEEAVVSLSGDMGYLIERTTVTVNGPDGKPVTSKYRAVTIWRKQPDGSWKNVVDTANAGPDGP